uniref:Putative secreted protein n=1 Tax=Amblyomma americanum TaxID=6943 RepID=A0A0C9S3E1_AMBAM
MKSAPLYVLLPLTLIVASECQMHRAGPHRAPRIHSPGFQGLQGGVCGGPCPARSKLGDPCDHGRCTCSVNFMRGPLPGGGFYCMARVPRNQAGFPRNGR